MLLKTFISIHFHFKRRNGLKTLIPIHLTIVLIGALLCSDSEEIAIKEFAQFQMLKRAKESSKDPQKFRRAYQKSVEILKWPIKNPEKSLNNLEILWTSQDEVKNSKESFKDR